VTETIQNTLQTFTLHVDEYDHVGV